MINALWHQCSLQNIPKLNTHVLKICDHVAPFTEAAGLLPAASHLIELLQQWRSSYRQSLGVTGLHLESISVQTGRLSEIQECRTVSTNLQIGLKQWLASPESQSIGQRLREAFVVQDAIGVLLRTNDNRLHRLPWHVWGFIFCRT